MLKWFKRKKKSKLPVRNKGNVCLNCQSILVGDEDFCPVCGQRNNINPLSFNIVVDEFVGNIISYDSRVWRTIVPLLIKPGKTAFDYISGKRKSLVNPFRSYITISLIFFLVSGVLSTLLSNSDEEGEIFQTDLENEAETIIKPQVLDSLELVKFNDSIIPLIRDEKSSIQKFEHLSSFYKNNRKLTSREALAKLGEKPTFWNRFSYEKIQKFFEIDDADDNIKFIDKIISGLSLTIFLILPLLALVLKLLYIRRRFTYMEHMVFVFYTQTVFFLLLLIFTIVYYSSGQNDNVYFLFMLLFPIYLFMAMKRFYGQHWFKTFIKLIIANFFFSLLAGIGFMFLVFISFILY